MPRSSRRVDHPAHLHLSKPSNKGEKAEAGTLGTLSLSYNERSAVRGCIAGRQTIRVVI